MEDDYQIQKNRAIKEMMDRILIDVEELSKLLDLTNEYKVEPIDDDSLYYSNHDKSIEPLPILE